MSRDFVVRESIESELRDKCVDLFERTDGTHGFEEYRRDMEDARWSVIGHFASRIYRSQDEALSAAIDAVTWLGKMVSARGK